MADERIRTALGAYIEDAPFVFSVRAEKFGPKNGLIVFPAINGSTLIASKSLNKLPETCAKIGAALGKVHIGCLLSKGLLEDFYRNDCDLTNHEILMH